MEKIKNKLENKSERPPVLYHGSPTPDLEELKPKTESWRDKKEGPQVFATSDKRLATIFIGKEFKESSIVRSGKFGDIPYAVILGSREEFIKDDKGGYIYTLPTNKFECDPEKGLGVNEWTCKVTVKPRTVEKFDSALDAMLEAGVQVYFVDDKIYQKINESKDHGYSTLKTLKSENQCRGVNVKVLI